MFLLLNLNPQFWGLCILWSGAQGSSAGNCAPLFNTQDHLFCDFYSVFNEYGANRVRCWGLFIDLCQVFMQRTPVCI